MTNRHGHFNVVTHREVYEHRTPRLNPFSGGWTQGAPWVKRLIVINIVIWVVMVVSIRVSEDAALRWWLSNIALTPSQVYQGKIWQLFTAMFMHSPAPLHLAFNMLYLFIFGPRVERDKGPAWFIRFYMLCGLAAGLFSLLSHTLLGQLDTPGAGASGAVLGVVAAFCLTYHMEMFWIFWAMPVRILYIFYFVLAVELAWVLSPAQDCIDHYAHVGGLLTAFVYLKAKWPRFGLAEGKKKPPAKRPRLAPRKSTGEKPSDFLEV